jgi:ribonuclease III
MHSLEKKLNYKFKNSALLELALIHTSYGNEQRPDEVPATKDNEQLEFLGDAVLDFLISVFLIKKRPELNEGALSKLRASLVNEKTLAQIARDLNLGEHLLLGKGEETTKGREKDSILSSALEALVAALYYDAGLAHTQTWIDSLFENKISFIEQDFFTQDFKTKLQEIVQSKYKSAPKYEVLSTSGPDHEKTFQVQVLIQQKPIAQGIGKSKKEAEQRAAETALEQVLNKK